MDGGCGGGYSVIFIYTLSKVSVHWFFLLFLALCLRCVVNIYVMFFFC